jgi:hypothetical protein
MVQQAIRSCIAPIPEYRTIALKSQAIVRFQPEIHRQAYRVLKYAVYGL